MGADFLIVGQGLAGTLLAWEFERAGFSFAIADAGHGRAASGVAAGIINPITGRRLVKSWRIDARLAGARAEWPSALEPRLCREAAGSGLCRLLAQTGFESGEKTRRQRGPDGSEQHLADLLIGGRPVGVAAVIGCRGRWGRRRLIGFSLFSRRRVARARPQHEAGGGLSIFQRDKGALIEGGRCARCCRRHQGGTQRANAEGQRGAAQTLEEVIGQDHMREKRARGRDVDRHGSISVQTVEVDPEGRTLGQGRRRVFIIAAFIADEEQTGVSRCVDRGCNERRLSR